jgi:hypothetical protein
LDLLSVVTWDTRSTDCLDCNQSLRGWTIRLLRLRGSAQQRRTRFQWPFSPSVPDLGGHRRCCFHSGWTRSHIFSTYFDNAVVAEPTFWPRTVLQSVFLPLRTASRSASAIHSNTNTNDVLRAGNPAPSLVVLPGFDAIRNRLIRAPILRLYHRQLGASAETRAWIATITDSTSGTTIESLRAICFSRGRHTPAMVP